MLLRKAFAVLMMSTCLAGAADACELKIGVPGPLSGPATQWGLALRGAVEFVAAEAMQQQLIKENGQACKITVIPFDSKYSAEGAAAAVNSFAADGIKVVIGPVGSPEVTGTKPLAMRNHMIVMLNSFAKDSIGPQWPNVFHIGPGPSGWASPIIQVAKEMYKFDTALIVAPNDQGGTDIASVNAQAFAANGVKVTQEYFQRGTTNFAPIIARIMNAAPGAVDLASTPGGDAGIIVKQLRQAGFTGPILRLGGAGYPEIKRVAGGDEVLKDFVWYEPIYMTDQLQAVDAQYEKLMGGQRPENADFFRWLFASRMVMKAIANAGTLTDADKIAAELRKLPVSDPDGGEGHWIGKKFFGINQELSFPFAIGRVQNGKLLPLLRHDAVSEN